MSVTTFSDPFDAAGAEPTAWWPSTTSGTILPTSLGTGATPSSILSVLGISQRDKIIRELVDDGYWVKMTGSRVTKDGWTNESDWDYVVYDPDKKLRSKFLAEDGWVLGSDAGRGEFDSIKLNGVNLILVDKEEIWKKYIIATNLIKTLNSMTKGERCAVFDSVFGKDSNAKALEF
jgi:predicted nucleotidyltransferase